MARCSVVQPLVIFDADGTLLDSLPAHVRFLHHHNDRLRLGLALPSTSDVAGMRAIAAAPMDRFIAKAGFPDDVVADVDKLYQATFSTDFPVGVFEGVAGMLERLRDAGCKLAIVSSNTRVNVEAALGPELTAHFAAGVWGVDNGPSRDKSVTLRSVVEGEAAGSGGSGTPSPLVYVGDTSKDFVCSTAAGYLFVGVSYGFEDLRPLGADKGFAVVDTVADLAHQLLATVGAASPPPP